MVDPISPTDKEIQSAKMKLRVQRINETVVLINKGLKKGKTSFNSHLDNLPCSMNEAEHVAKLFNESGWERAKVIDDNYQTFSIIIEKSRD